MTDIVKLIKQQTAFRPRGTVTSESVMAAEQELDLCFADDYRRYIQAYGAASFVEHELTGICKSVHLNVVAVTKEERMFADVPADWYVIEQTHIDGIVIWQDSAGIVYQTSPDAIAIKLCDSLAEYIEMSL